MTVTEISLFYKLYDTRKIFIKIIHVIVKQPKDLACHSILSTEHTKK